ncbi:hypothetical protein [Telmatospirillum sp.]|uniref:hypothetical protein n=1 Tax=Telmatospirillum sp. TaxID=2079197 RepID=UPI002847CADF|nr:hypothetical protein [Telmatospirillum sp.]MDR3440906.1 hypothetical protein [Telmatospirillum sp.]
MTEKEFRRLSSIYGADISRWPNTVQITAGRWLGDHPEARRDLRAVDEFDRLLIGAAPQIGTERVERIVRRAVVRLAGNGMPQESFAVALAGGRDWRWTSQGAVYLGLFILGCAANTAVRLLSAQTPFDLLFATNISLPLGG